MISGIIFHINEFNITNINTIERSICIVNTIKGKTALITGGGSGIGKAIVEEIARLGAIVFIHYNTSRKPAEELVESINKKDGEAYSFGADLTSAEEVKDLLGKIQKKSSRLDILINNAGTLHKRTLLKDMTIDFYREVSRINLESMMMVIKESLPLMKNRGGASIVNISSTAGRKGGNAGSLAYSTVKGAILTMTKCLANEFAPFDIRVNAVTPGMILGTRIHANKTSDKLKKEVISKIPLGRAGTCDEVARAVAFLASDMMLIMLNK